MRYHLMEFFEIQFLKDIPKSLLNFFIIFIDECLILGELEDYNLATYTISIFINAHSSVEVD